MPDLPQIGPAPLPPRGALLEQLRVVLPELLPGLRVVAADVLGAETRIDFVGVDPQGRAAVVLVGEAGEDLELVGRGIAQRTWLEAHLPDWLQLAPELDLRADLAPKLVLLCPSFAAETVAAARGLGEAAPLLATVRCVRNGAGTRAFLEPHPAEPARRRAAAVPGPPPPAFRTGLSDADLGLTAEERGEFE